MADRDLLNKPLPAIAPEGDEAKRSLPAPQLGKLGVLDRAREVGREAEAKPATKQEAKASAQARPQGPAQKGAVPTQSQPPAAPVQEKAFRSAYFNRDTAAIGTINQRARPMAALRGQEGATDLKRVVLPVAAGAEDPNPERLHGALLRMAGEHNLAPDLGALLGRQAAWTKREGVTAEAIAARQQELEAQVALRREALARMRQLAPSHLEGTPTLTQAVLSLDADAAAAPDPQAEAEALIDATARRGAGLMGRLAKVMGSKR